MDLLKKYDTSEQLQIRIIADSILIFCFMGRMERITEQITGYPVSPDKPCYALFFIADNFSSGLLTEGYDKGYLSEKLIEVFFATDYDIKNFTEKGSELVEAEKIFLKWVELKGLYIKGKLPE